MIGIILVEVNRTHRHAGVDTMASVLMLCLNRYEALGSKSDLRRGYYLQSSLHATVCIWYMVRTLFVYNLINSTGDVINIAPLTFTS